MAEIPDVIPNTFSEQVFNPLIRPLNHKDVEKFVFGSTQNFISTANILMNTTSVASNNVSLTISKIPVQISSNWSTL